MITFKQFLMEIETIDHIITKDVSDDTVRGISMSDLSVKPYLTNFVISGFTIKRLKNESSNLALAVVDDKKQAVAVLLVLTKRSIELPSGKLIMYETLDLTSRVDYRGKQLPLALYSALIKSGMPLLSSNVQTTGSRKLWFKLIESGIGEMFILASDDDANRYFDKFGHGSKKTHSMLLTGSLVDLKNEAYARSNTRVVLLPINYPNISLIKNMAINISENNTINTKR